MSSELRILAAALALALVLPASRVEPAVSRVAIVRASSLGPFTQATQAIIDTLRAETPQPEILTFDLEGDESRGAATVVAVRAATPTVVVTVGSLATSIMLRAPELTAPIVFSMVLYPEESGFLAKRAEGVTGVALDVPLDVQLETLHRLVPAARRVGVLYNPDETGRIVERARAASGGQRLELVSEEVHDATRAVEALERLAERVDVVWSVADSHVFTPQTTSALILAALRRRLPLVGLSTAHVRAGTLAALTVDYADVGRQTGEITARLLRGTKADQVPVAAPRRVSLALNLRTAEHIGLTVDPVLVAEATEVVR